MGRHMARNLLQAGHPVKAFDLVAAAVDEAVGHGAQAAASAAEAASGVEVVISMLPEGAHVREVYTGEGGVLDVAAGGTLLIDSSTIDVATAREVAGLAAERGLEMIDAPVSGGTMGADAGTLTFMVGGSDAAFERGRPVLEAMGGNIVHTGGPGNGQAAKICNNMMMAINMIGTCEAFDLAQKLGLDAQVFFDIASTSSGQCWATTSYCPVPGPVPGSPANRDYEPGFTVAMMLKDLKLSQAAAGDVSMRTRMGENATSMYQDLSDTGQGPKDLSVMYRYLSGEGR